jgi:hypothetical protein
MTTREHETQSGAAEPPVIDLDAEEVASASDTARPEEPKPEIEEPKRPARRMSGRTLAAGALIVVAVIAGGFLYRGFGERLWPSDRMVAIEDRLATLDATARTLNNQIAGLGAAVDAMKSANSAITARIEDAAAKAAAEQRTSSDERITQVEADLRSLQEQLASLTASVKSSSGGVDTGVSAAELSRLSARVSALEEAVAALKAAPPSPAGGSPETAALSQALADLKAKLASGTPYEAEVQTIDRLAPGIAALGRLLPYAATGLPTADALAHEIERIAAGLPGPEPQVDTADSGYWGSFTSLLGSIVKVRTIGEPDWKDITAKAGAAARSGDLAGAIAGLDVSEAPLPAELARWRDTAKARIGADVAIEEVSAAVLRLLSKSAGKS